MYEAFMDLICPSTKKVRGIARKTQDLRDTIMLAFEDVDKPIIAREMFYLLSVRKAVVKTEAGYRQAQRQLVLMRREGIIPYGWIADNTRWMKKPETHDSIEDALADTARFYRRSVWNDLDVYVEVWCEKDSLAGVLYPVTAKYDVPLMVTRGYSSESFAYGAAEDIKEQGKPAYIYYVGDFDPSGWQMAVNLEEKLMGFGADVEFIRLAITLEQALQGTLPSRPTKKTDTRCRAFFDLFGKDTSSIELDALHPNELRRIVRDAIEQHIPVRHLDLLKVAEDSERDIFGKLMKVAAGMAG